MRAMMIVNPTATKASPAAQELVTHALQSRLKLTIEHTTHRGHGGELAQAAAEDGIDLIVVHGGDGTVSNVVNGLLGRPGTLPTGHVPAVAILPGGSANVLARQLGIPPDPVAATNQLIELLDQHAHHQEWRRIGVIDCGERWAVLNAGMGTDAEAVAAVEARREKGIQPTPARYTFAAVLACLAYRRREPRLTLHIPGHEPISGVYFTFVSNSCPWTYSNNRPMYTNPGASFETGLGIFAVKTMPVIGSLLLVRDMFAKHPKLDTKLIFRDDDASSLRITCSGPPMASQFDGDYLGVREEMTFRSVPNALAVVAPPPNKAR